VVQNGFGICNLKRRQSSVGHVDSPSVFNLGLFKLYAMYGFDQHFQTNRLLRSIWQCHTETAIKIPFKE